MKQYEKITSFTQRPSVPQIVSYILFLLQVITFYTLIQSNYSQEISRTLFHILFAISISGEIIFTIITSCIDPSDTYMIEYKNDRIKYI